jgi:secreted Zn-dependent insulinase-like peptidase
MGLTYDGYSGKLADLAKVVLNDVTDLTRIWEHIDPVLFEDCKEKHSRALKSWYKDRPDSQAASILSYLLNEDSLLVSEKIALLERTDLSFLQKRINRIIQSVTSHHAYVHGSFRQEEAVELYETVINSFYSNTKKVEISEKDFDERIRVLPKSVHHVVALPPFNVEDPNNAYLLYIQVFLSDSIICFFLLAVFRLKEGHQLF